MLTPASRRAWTTCRSDEPEARAASPSRMLGSLRLWRWGATFSSTPPPTVTVGEKKRTTKWSPFLAATGSVKRSWAKPVSPASSVSRPSSTHLHTSSRLPWWKWSRESFLMG